MATASPRPKLWLSPLALAVFCAATAIALVEANGGLWERVGGADLHSYFVPRFQVAAAALRAGRLPLWNPLEYCGEPFFASPQVGTLYAPVPVLFSLLRPRAALAGLWALHVLLMSWAMLAYLSRYVASPAARVVGVLVALGGSAVAKSMDQPGFVGGSAWLPVLILCWDRAVHPEPGDAGAGARWLGALGLAVAGQWLSGYPDFAMDSAVLLGLVALTDDRSPLARRLAVCIAGLAIGLLLTAVQILPLAEAVAESVRPERAHFYPGLRRAFAVRSIAALWERVVTLGPAALVVAAASLLRPTRTRLAWAVALVWAVFAVTPPLSLLYWIPPFSGSRIPIGWWFMAPVLLGYLTAAGIGDWSGPERRPPVRAVGAVLALAAALQGGWCLWRAPDAGPRLAPDVAETRRRAEDVARAQAVAPPGTRFLGVRSLPGSLLYELPNAAGYDPLAPRRIQHLLDEIGVEILHARVDALASRADLAALLGVGIVLAPERATPRLRAAGFEPMRSEGQASPTGEVALYRRPLPRAYVVHRAVPVDGEAASLAWVLAHAGEARETVAVEDPLAGDLVEPERAGSSAAVEEASIVREAPEEVAIRAVVASPGLLVLGDTWYPGWTATVDGAPADVFRVNHAFRGVPVGAGVHEVVFRYRPGWLVPGAVISAAGLALAVLLLAAPRWLRRPFDLGTRPRLDESRDPR